MAAAPAGWHHLGPELYPVMPERIVALDLIRGVAVLGILAINIAGFADPLIATTTPHLPHPGTQADEIAFAASFLLFEGKMRALFTILFGASMLLFLERAEAAGKDAAPLQMRRLGWLMLFGYLHFALIWWGDILFVYALCGFIALAFRFMATRPLVIFALTLFVLSHAQGMVASMPEVLAEEHASHGVAPPGEATQHREAMLAKLTDMRTEVALYRGPYAAQVDHRLTDQRFFPLAMAIGSICETLPLMLLGMALYRSGFFSGGWPTGRLKTVAIAGIVTGGAATLAVLAWVWPRYFPPLAMNALLANGMAVPHLLLALGYSALLMLAAPRLLQSRLGVRLSAAGRMAFSNYIGTSLVMTAIFYGWGLDLFATIGAAGQMLFVALGWTLMLGWSKPWLGRFKQGPLEWLWRMLTEWRVLPLSR
ncbi:MAG: hypothetical protein JWQ16_2343 [Novosphingobium sp.]|nr:hypothetical protein [Novosphingobium sp.]